MRTFEAESMHEALSKVKQEMGEDAVIVKNRKVSRRSGGKLVELFEVTAALENETSPAKPGKSETYDWRGGLPRVDEQGRPQGRPSPITVGPQRSPTAPASVKADGEKAQAKFIDMLRSEFRDVKESVEMPTRELRLLTEELRVALASAQNRDPLSIAGEGSANAMQEHLSQCGFEKSEARRLMIAVLAQLPPDPPSAEIGQSLRRQIVQEVRCSGGVRFVRGRPTRIALVGPAGAGKTTSLLKLAAIAALRTGRKVGLLAGDSVRLGAQAQLEVFGRTSGMPVAQVYGPEDLPKAYAAMDNCDLLLLDTAGRAPQGNDAEADRQVALVQAFQPDEVLLTLSATTRARELENQCRRFQAYRPGSFILTRLDECLELGVLHTLARRTGMPLGYLCDGPSIPEHIQTAKPHHLAHLLIPEPQTNSRMALAGP